MNNSTLTEKQITRRIASLLTGWIVFFLAWMFYLEPITTQKIQNIAGINIYDLPESISATYSFIFGLLPPLIIGTSSYIYAYNHWLMPNRTKVANEQLKKIAEARKAMINAVNYIELFEKELQEKSSEAEILRDKVASLKTLNSENAAELEKKLKAMESLTLNRIWFERGFAFFIGILSSIASTYLLQIIQQLA